MRREIALIAAMDRNRLIGADGALPWRLPNDLGWFRRCTLDKPVVMGRRTWGSLPRRPLPRRHNIVVTSQPDYAAPGATLVRSFEAALEAAKGQPEVVVIGGGALFDETIPFADRLYLTVVHGEFSGDTWFPFFDTSEWRETFREDHEPDERHSSGYSFLVWERTGD